MVAGCSFLMAAVLALAVSPPAPDSGSAADSDATEVVVASAQVESAHATDGEACDAAEEEDAGPEVNFGDWVGYNASRSQTTWVAGGDFGMVSMESFPTLELGTDAALMFGTGFHFLKGPRVPDMPPRLFDFQMAFQARKRWSERSMWDIKLGVGAFSDFESSARKGVRYPGHIVRYVQHRPTMFTVLGVESLDRDDISVLPVVGYVFQPDPDLIVECLFPRPKIQLQLDRERVMYVAGELGGGTWAIERENGATDNATYRDLRLTWGIHHFGRKSKSTTEIGWAFDRTLKYRSTRGDTGLENAFLLRFHTLY